MDKNTENKIRYYKSYTDDFMETKNQNYRIPEHYKWVHKNFIYGMWEVFVYILAKIFSFVYCKLILHIRYENRKAIKQCKKTGFFLYGNHTQPMGDAFSPVIAVSPKRIHVVVSAANLGIPVLGKILPAMGAMPVPENISQMKKFFLAIQTRISQKRCVVIYPEAHLWPWYTGIRPFAGTSFKFPVEQHKPSFCMTTTYQKRKDRKKPGITVYIDGPFYPDKNLPKKKQAQKLCDDISNCMKERSKNSNYSYIEYMKEE